MYIYIFQLKKLSSSKTMSFGDVRPDDSQWHYTVLDDRSFEIRGKTLFFIVVIFSVFLVVGLLLLYARWACRYRHVSSPPPNPDPPPSQGLDAAAIKRLPVVSHHSEASAAECCICLGVFEDGEKVKVLPRCYHCYHPECVDRWLSAQPSCPMCRNSLRVDSAVLKVVVE